MIQDYVVYWHNDDMVSITMVLLISIPPSFVCISKFVSVTKGFNLLWNHCLFSIFDTIDFYDWTHVCSLIGEGSWVRKVISSKILS